MTDKQFVDLLLQVEKASATINFRSEIRDYDLHTLPQMSSWLQEDKYFRCMAGFCKFKQVKHALDIGTGYGCSSLALSKYAQKVTTVDIEVGNVPDSRLTPHIVKLTDRDVFPDFPVDFPVDLKPKVMAVQTSDRHDVYRKPKFSNYDLIFVDLGMDRGYYDEQVHHALVAQKYQGFAFYDDIHSYMFWDKIQQLKLPLKWHGSSGFGVVYYAG